MVKIIHVKRVIGWFKKIIRYLVCHLVIELIYMVEKSL